MKKINEVTRDQLSVISSIFQESVVAKSDDIIIANKVVKAKPNSKLNTISIYKDLFFKCSKENNYVSLTDTNNFHDIIQCFDKNILYKLTNGTALEYFNYPNSRYMITNIDTLYDYGLIDNPLDYEAAIELLTKINKYIDSKVKANIIRQYGKDALVQKNGIMKFHMDNIDEISDIVNIDPVSGLTLAKKFEK